MQIGAEPVRRNVVLLLASVSFGESRPHPPTSGVNAQLFFLSLSLDRSLSFEIKTTLSLV